MFFYNFLGFGAVMQEISGVYEITNKLGLHARPVSLFVQIACTYDSEVKVENMNTSMSADGKSMMSMLMLAAVSGTKLKITVSGNDADSALKALGALVSRGFDEE